MFHYPIMAAEYLEYDTNTEYNMIQLPTAFDLKGTYQHVDHESITPVIYYIISKIINDTSPLILSFTLDDDVVFFSVPGIPGVLAINTVVYLVKGQLACSELSQVFILNLDHPGK